MQELACELELPVDKVIEILMFALEPISLDEPLREDGDSLLQDVIEDKSALSPEDVAEVSAMPELVEELLGNLDAREQEIVKLRFGVGTNAPKTLEEVGEHFNLTRERIRQIEARAFGKLRHPSTGARLRGMV